MILPFGNGSDLQKKDILSSHSPQQLLYNEKNPKGASGPLEESEILNFQKYYHGC